MSTRASVVIPMYNASKTILETLRGLESQTRDDLEVLVVDDGSTDESPALVEQFAHSSRLPLKLIRQPNAGPAAARNNGARQAKGDVLVFLDSDCVPPQAWLDEMVKHVKGNVAGSHCGYRVKNGHSLVARYIDLEIARRHERLVGQEIDTVASYAAAISRRAFEEAGAFSPDYTEANAEDFDLAFKLRRCGYRLVFTGDTFVYHYHPESLRKYLRQQYTRGYWRVKMYLRNREKIVGGDSYTGHEAQVQFLLASAAMASLPLVAVSYLVPLACAGALLLSNLPLGIWAAGKERKMAALAPVIASMRSVAGALGACSYLLDVRKRRVKGER